MTQHYTQCRHCQKLFVRSERHLHPCYEGEIKIATHYVIPDIQPYQAMGVDAKTGTNPMITSRREHKEYLKRNEYVEIGNEMPKERKYSGDHDVRKELAEATRHVLSQHRH